MTELAVSKPIVGEVGYYSEELPEQRSVAEFEALLDAVWESGVTSVRWNQYTPYFNDGEPCVFGSDLNAYTIEALPEREEGEEFLDFEEDEYDDDTSWRPVWRIEESMPERDAINALKQAINGNEFYNVLIKNFGDPATVIATPDEFRVEFFEHE